ncbi:MAG: thiamine phosphate synthase, partial [Phycisphaeraceae bacterium]
DTPGDVGTTIKTDREFTRESVADVAIAAGKRLSEALRTIEEYAKTLPPLPLGQARGEGKAACDLAPAIERLRYRGYDLEQRLNRALGTGLAKQWLLCVLLSESLCKSHDWQHVLDAALDAGADCVQLREKDLDEADLLHRATQIVSRCRRSGATAIINDRPDIALLAGADGVHLGQYDLPVTEVRKLVGRQLLIGVSTCHLDQARAAIGDGADYCGVGPMFDTTTKQKDTLAGPEYLKQFVEAFPTVPHLAIGGITPENVNQLIEAGARGIAVSSAICQADQPDAVTQQLLAQLPITNQQL